MKSITEQISELAGDLLKKSPEIRNENSGFSMFNDGGVECEVGEFLYGMVRVLKPDYVLETGTHMGIASSYIASALIENRKDRPNGMKGTLETLEIEQQHIETSKALWTKLGVNNVIVSYRTVSLDFDSPNLYDLILLDTEPDIRFKELVKFYKNLKPGGYFFIHDLNDSLCQGNINPDHPEIHSYPFGDLPPEIIQWVKEDKLRPFFFENPRGMTGFYKPKETAYKWR